MFNYKLNDNFNLCFCKIKKEKTIELSNRRSNNRHIKKLDSEYDLFRIPNIKNTIALIEKIHYNIIHQGTTKMKFKINQLKLLEIFKLF